MGISKRKFDIVQNSEPVPVWLVLFITVSCSQSFKSLHQVVSDWLHLT